LSKETIILAIESSCDDTSAAVLKNNRVLSNVVAGQKIHEQYGGVVPELASRAHQQNIVPVVDAALKNAGIEKNELTAVAFTKGPGLLGSLIVGVSFAKSFALGLNLPLIEINHMKGHVLAHFIDDGNPMPSFPFICLTVSGGHTQIVLVHDFLKMEIVGTTLDDAAGEAFDKSAKMLGIPYPGGPMIDRYAQEGNPARFQFTKPKVEGLNYSFSGLKTNILQFLQREEKTNPHFIQENSCDICASIQATIIDMLFEKLILATQKYNIKTIAIAGGVSANSGLRNELQKRGKENNWKVFVPKFEYCTDNAAMIGITAYYQFLNANFSDQNSTPNARLPF
jgi:N6-L-threonylcarbamoyladenine synthase